jgi:hypothetical protein
MLFARLALKLGADTIFPSVSVDAVVDLLASLPLSDQVKVLEHLQQALGK